ncbi:MAG: hypothetical protein K2N48_08400 [Muribaculaceae bacterium]|nr:hypothetical protein [Muribaculaceae bacterium]
MKKSSGELEYYIVIPRDRIKESYKHAPQEKKKQMEEVLKSTPPNAFAMTGEMMFVNPHKIHREGIKKVINSYEDNGSIGIVTDTVPVFSFVGIFLIREHDADKLFGEE